LYLNAQAPFGREESLQKPSMEINRYYPISPNFLWLSNKPRRIALPEDVGDHDHDNAEKAPALSTTSPAAALDFLPAFPNSIWERAC
jgi:hypothetical protein